MRPCAKSYPSQPMGYRMLRGRSRYQMAHLSESPVMAPSQSVRLLLMAPKPKVYFQREQSEPEVFCGNRPRGVTVSTLDFETSDRGSNPREVSRQILKTELKKRMQHCTRQHHRLCFNAFCVRKAILPNPWVPYVERTLSIPDGTTLRKS